MSGYVITAGILIILAGIGICVTAMMSGTAASLERASKVGGWALAIGAIVIVGGIVWAVVW